MSSMVIHISTLSKYHLRVAKKELLRCTKLYPDEKHQVRLLIGGKLVYRDKNPIIIEAYKDSEGPHLNYNIELLEKHNLTPEEI